TTGISAQSGITTLSGKKCLDLWGQIHLVHYALERMQVSYNGEHQQHPLLYPLVLANREELIEQGCTFKLKSADLFNVVVN
ncbi:hypothetical protein ACK31N_05185, partial [Aeromonas caviae]